MRLNLGNRLGEAGKYRRREGGEGGRRGWLFSCSLPWFIITWWARCMCVCVWPCVMCVATHWGGPVAFVQIKCWCRVETAGQSGAQVIKVLPGKSKNNHTHTHTHTHTLTAPAQWGFYFGKQTEEAEKWTKENSAGDRPSMGSRDRGMRESEKTRDKQRGSGGVLKS